MRRLEEKLFIEMRETPRRALFEGGEEIGLQRRYICRKEKSAVEGDLKKNESRIEAESWD